MTTRRSFLALLGGGAAAWPVGAWAQQPDRMRRVGVLIGIAEGDPQAALRIPAIREGLQALGWAEGRNISLDFRFSSGSSERMKDAASDIVAADGLAQISDSSSLEPIVRRIVDAHPDIIAEIKAGKDRKFQFLVGQVMKETKGKGDPKIVTELLKNTIG